MGVAKWIYLPAQLETSVSDNAYINALALAIRNCLIMNLMFGSGFGIETMLMGLMIKDEFYRCQKGTW
jgi:hypothetical protein